MNAVRPKCWYWKGTPNFGDRLTPLILKRFINIDVEYSSLAQADVVGIGSILGLLPYGFRGTIIGSGRMHEGMPVRLRDARVLALRGPLSAQGVAGDYALGDLGILASHLVDPAMCSRDFKLGIVPHWSDTELIERSEFRRYDPFYISVKWDPIEVVEAIARCDKIVTSSLHALIVADSFGIPRRFEYAKRFDREGGIFKFRDYSQSIRAPFEVGVTYRASRFEVERVQDELYDVLRAYQGIVLNGS